MNNSLLCKRLLRSLSHTALMMISLVLVSAHIDSVQAQKTITAHYIGSRQSADAHASGPRKRKRMRAGRNGNSRLAPPKIDGRLDDPAWQHAQSVADFTQRDPEEGEAGTEKTEVKILYDDQNLYLGFFCYDSEPDKIVAREMRTDADLQGDDYIRILIDTYLDRRNAFYFETNPLGARRDAQISDEGKVVNTDWNCVWEVESQITEQGWTAEIRIPLNQLRYPDIDGEPRWGINFGRYIGRKREDVYWSPILRDYGFGNRGFFKVSKAGDLVGLEQMRRRKRLEIKPFNLSGLGFDRSDNLDPLQRSTVFNGGLDLKYGLTASLIADVTVNTDFAQVEADQERVNLTRFSLFFPEKRDFFLEGAGIFGIGQGGRPGRGGPTEQLFYSRRIGLSAGQEVKILGGAKITGNAGGLEIGLLNVVTDRYSDGDESLPRRNYSALRFRRPVLERSYVGAMVLSRDALDNDEFNRTFVADANFSFGANTVISSWLAKTSEYGAVNARDLAGFLAFNHRSDRYSFRVNYTDIQDDFNADHMGFILRTGIRRTNVETGLGVRPDWAWLRRFFAGPEMSYLTDQNNVLQTRRFQLTSFTQFEAGHVLFIAPRRMYELLDFDWTINSDKNIVIPRGIYEFSDVNFFLRTDRARPVALRIGGNAGGFFSGNALGGNLSMLWRVSNQFSIDLSYNGNKIDLPPGAFTTHVLSTRLVYTFSTDMFAKAYIQWNSTAELVSINFLYNFYYRPGSNIYLVYNHLWDLGASQVSTRNSTLLLKVNYWLNM